MVHYSVILRDLMSLVGTPYRLGAEASPRDPDPDAMDCSEAIQWACNRNGVPMPDGAWAQFDWCRQHRTLVPVGTAISTPMGLLIRQFGSGAGGGGGNHIAGSRGNGWTIEARGRAWGTGTWTAYNRGWTNGALIPGVAYDAAAPGAPWPAPRPDIPLTPPEDPDTMFLLRCNIPGNPKHGVIHLIAGGHRRHMKDADQARDVRWLVGQEGGGFYEITTAATWMRYMAAFPPLTPADDV